MKKVFEIELPIKIGDKVWMCTNKGSCNFLERYKQYSEFTVINVKVEFNMYTDEQEIWFTTDNPNSSCWYKYDGKTAFTKEQLYESFREEIEQLIPEDLRKYLWNVSPGT